MINILFEAEISSTNLALKLSSFDQSELIVSTTNNKSASGILDPALGYICFRSPEKVFI